MTYLLFLKCEVVGEDRIRKVRAMMLRKDLLEHFPYDEDPAWYDEWLSQNPLTVSKFIEVVPSYPLFFRSFCTGRYRKKGGLNGTLHLLRCLQDSRPAGSTWSAHPPKCQERVACSTGEV